MSHAGRMPSIIAGFLGLLVAACVAPACAQSAASVLRSQAPDDQVAHDAQGRALYIVDLERGALAAQPERTAVDARFEPYLSAQAVNLVKSMESQYRFHVRQMTSLTRLSFSAALSDAQIEALADDPRVERISPDIYLYPSTPPSDTTAVWRDSATTAAEPPNSQWLLQIAPPPAMQSWGRTAMVAGKMPPSTGVLVYVLDGGVGQHAALNVVERVNGVVPVGNDCGTRVGLAPCTAAQLSNVVGCYTHATWVAGVIGASTAQGGTRGMFPGVGIVSVAVYPPPSTAHTCVSTPSASQTPESDMAKGLEWIGQDIAARGVSGRPSVINMSYNWSYASATPAGLIAQIQAITGSRLKGAVFVQSAGNFYRPAADSAYAETSTTDGVLVVGAINAHGQPVKPLNGLHGFWKDVANGANPLVLHQPGSSYGAAVDVWAPGDAILTTTGGIPQQSGTALYTNYAYVSGTSLAAPHVAGLAALMIAADTSLATPTAVETKLRTRVADLGSHDAANLPIRLPTLATLPAVRNTPYAESWISERCYIPYFATYQPGCTFLREIPTVGMPNTPAGLTRDHGIFYRAAGAQLYSFDSKGEGAYACDVTWTDTGFETRLIGSGQKQYFLNIAPSVLGSTLPGTLSSRACPTAALRLQTD